MSEQSACAPVIHIGGWPGAGKKTIGRLVAQKLAGRLIDNHLMLDAARAIYDRGVPGSAELREEVRAVILDHAARLPRDVPLVMTDALADEPAAAPLFQPSVDLAARRGAALMCFVLELDVTENLRRLTDPSRTGNAKLRDADVLRDIRAEQTLFVPEGARVIDVTRMTAQQAADIICAHIGDPSSTASTSFEERAGQ